MTTTKSLSFGGRALNVDVLGSEPTQRFHRRKQQLRAKPLTSSGWFHFNNVNFTAAICGHLEDSKADDFSFCDGAKPLAGSKRFFNNVPVAVEPRSA
ncbi:hypothetical protein QN395_05595 [Undibacterium sp. RTI2.2]|nr:hypothetical protein [Undibacterium sp. RTI2.2]